MKKIAIVGVEGSGKTVMMAAMGEQWACPDEHGYFLSPESAETFGFSKTVMNMLRHGQWPNATNHDEMRTLDWSLQRRQGDSLDKIADISLLDYAGEVYRQAFGGENKEGYEAQVATLRSHVDEADVLIVLVNLSDIINGSMSDRRTLDAMYLTKSVLDYALGDKRKRKPHTTIVFTQADGYREIIAANGGTAGTLQQYLPHVANLYGSLPIFTASAIDMTVIGDDGLPIPAPGFKSTGLNELMDWVIDRCEISKANSGQNIDEYPDMHACPLKKTGNDAGGGIWSFFFVSVSGLVVGLGGGMLFGVILNLVLAFIIEVIFGVSHIVYYRPLQFITFILVPIVSAIVGIAVAFTGKKQ